MTDTKGAELKASTIAALRLIQNNMNAAIECLVVGVEKGELTPAEIEAMERNLRAVAHAPALALPSGHIAKA
jgi:hypothetical protein